MFQVARKNVTLFLELFKDEEKIDLFFFFALLIVSLERMSPIMVICKLDFVVSEIIRKRCFFLCRKLTKPQEAYLIISKEVK